MKNKVYKKMTALVRHNSKEIAWHFVINRKDNQFMITDILVFPQYVTAATAVATDEYEQQWMPMLQDHVFNNLRGHGHSHVNMGVSPSATDVQYQKEILSQLSDNDYYIFMIVNKKGDYDLTLFDKTSGLVFSKLTYTITPTGEDKWAKEQDVYLKEKPKPKITYKPTAVNPNRVMEQEQLELSDDDAFILNRMEAEQQAEDEAYSRWFYNTRRASKYNEFK